MIQALASIYKPRFSSSLIQLVLQAENKPIRFLNYFWRVSDFNSVKLSLNTSQKIIARLLFVALLITQVFLLIWGYSGYRNYLAGALQFSLALVVAAPLILAHLIALFLMMSKAINISLFKSLGRKYLSYILSRQVQRLRAKYEFKIIAVVGSAGKTSTKHAIVELLRSKYKVQSQDGNYNVDISVPMVVFGQKLPNLLSIIAWWKIIKANNETIKQGYDFDFVVLELGTDGPGQLKKFKYLKPDLSIITAIASEHMEYFKNIEQVAKEELQVTSYSKKLLINTDDVDPSYLLNFEHLSYGFLNKPTYKISDLKRKNLKSQSVSFQLASKRKTKLNLNILGIQGAKVSMAAAATAHIFGLKTADIKKAISEVVPFAGRMQLLPGIKDSLIIDDTYNASPIAVKAALDVLIESKAKQRIALLGNMNELGSESMAAHTELGSYCNKRKLAFVVTLGPDANKYLAPAARQAGCTVFECNSPEEAGMLIKSKIIKGAVVLIKGSQNKVFAEEAVKILLKNKADNQKLVRQSAEWMVKKQSQFS